MRSIRPRQRQMQQSRMSIRQRLNARKPRTMQQMPRKQLTMQQMQSRRLKRRRSLQKLRETLHRKRLMMPA